MVLHNPTRVSYVVFVLSVFESASSSLQVGDIPDEILKIRREIEAEFLGEDQNWGRVETNVCSWTILQHALPLSVYGDVEFRGTSYIFSFILHVKCLTVVVDWVVINFLIHLWLCFFDVCSYSGDFVAHLV